MPKSRYTSTPMYTPLAVKVKVSEVLVVEVIYHGIDNGGGDKNNTHTGYI